jgi:BRCT domain type II-containing protein
MHPSLSCTPAEHKAEMSTLTSEVLHHPAPKFRVSESSVSVGNQKVYNLCQQDVHRADRKANAIVEASTRSENSNDAELHAFKVEAVPVGPDDEDVQEGEKEDPG